MRSIFLLVIISTAAAACEAPVEVATPTEDAGPDTGVATTEPVISINGATCTQVESEACAVVYICDYSKATYPIANQDALPPPNTTCHLLGGPIVGDIGWCCTAVTEAPGSL